MAKGSEIENIKGSKSELVTTQMNTDAIFVKVKIPSFTSLCVFKKGEGQNERGNFIQFNTVRLNKANFF